MLGLFKKILYIRLQAEKISILDPKTEREYSDIPVIAIREEKGKKTVVAVGMEASRIASMENLQLENGFKHPRTLIANFTIAEQTLKHMLKHFSGKGFSLAPTIIMHPLGEWEGGLTEIEKRTLLELAICTGAKNITLWQGKELSCEELLAGTFPPEKGERLLS